MARVELDGLVRVRVRVDSGDEHDGIARHFLLRRVTGAAAAGTVAGWPRPVAAVAGTSARLSAPTDPTEPGAFTLPSCDLGEDLVEELVLPAVEESVEALRHGSVLTQLLVVLVLDEAVGKLVDPVAKPGEQRSGVVVVREPLAIVLLASQLLE